MGIPLQIFALILINSIAWIRHQHQPHPLFIRDGYVMATAKPYHLGKTTQKCGLSKSKMTTRTPDFNHSPYHGRFVSFLIFVFLQRSFINQPFETAPSRLLRVDGRGMIDIEDRRTAPAVRRHIPVPHGLSSMSIIPRPSTLRRREAPSRRAD